METSEKTLKINPGELWQFVYPESDLLLASANGGRRVPITDGEHVLILSTKNVRDNYRALDTSFTYYLRIDFLHREHVCCIMCRTPHAWTQYFVEAKG